LQHIETDICKLDAILQLSEAQGCNWNAIFVACGIIVCALHIMTWCLQRVAAKISKMQGGRHIFETNTCKLRDLQLFESNMCKLEGARSLPVVLPSFPPSLLLSVPPVKHYFLPSCLLFATVILFLIDLRASLSAACSKYVNSSSDVSSPRPWLLHGIRE